MALATPSTPPPKEEWVSRRLRLPNDTLWQSLVDGLLSKLMDDWYYYQSPTGITPFETARVMGEILLEYASSDVYQLGVIVPYMTAAPPPFTIPCDGSTYNRVDYPNLYSVLDAAFIIDADTFKTPFIPGRTIVGAGVAQSTTEYTVNQEFGEESHSLTEDENANHTHSDIGHAHTVANHTNVLVVSPGEVPVSLILPLIPSSTGIASANIQSSGAGMAHENRQPSVALNFAVYAR